MHHRDRQHRPALARTPRSALAAALRVLAAVADAPSARVVADAVPVPPQI
jgi:hypothetical protein